MPALRDVGERALLLEVDQPAAAAAWVRSHAERRQVPVVDVVPAARTVLVTATTVVARTQLRRLLVDLPDNPDDSVDGVQQQHSEPVRIAVRFDGPDLADVARHAGVDPDGVVRLIVGTDFLVQFCGFSPGFAYLSGLPARLHMPRRAEPRVRVPAGSLAVADEYAAVYPRKSPGGWNLIGSTDRVLFDVERTPPALLVAGVRVRFEAS